MAPVASGNAQAAVPLAPLAANTWKQMAISLADLGVAGKPNLDGFWIQDTSGSPAPTFYLDDISLRALPETDLSFVGATFTATVPPQSITLFVLPAAAPPPAQLRLSAIGQSGTFELILSGQAGQRYILQSSTDLVQWMPVQTNTLTSAAWHYPVPATNASWNFYRAQWEP